MNQQSLKFIQALKDHADILSKYLEEHPEALARIVSELPTHQEPREKRHRHKYDRCKAVNCIGGVVATHLGKDRYCKCGKVKP